MEFTLRERPLEQDINGIRSKLQQYNRQFFEIEDDCCFLIEARMDEGELAGGIVFTVRGEWLNIDFLWVDEAQRGKDVGTKLLAQAEAKARMCGCRKAYLTTFNFQARPFYEKHGYKVVYTQRNYPVTNERYHMEKSL